VTVPEGGIVVDGQGETMRGAPGSQVPGSGPGFGAAQTGLGLTIAGQLGQDLAGPSGHASVIGWAGQVAPLQFFDVGANGSRRTA